MSQKLAVTKFLDQVNLAEELVPTILELCQDDKPESLNKVKNSVSAVRTTLPFPPDSARRRDYLCSRCWRLKTNGIFGVQRRLEDPAHICDGNQKAYLQSLWRPVRI